MYQVQDLVTNCPEFLTGYQVICVNSHITEYGDEYLVLGVRSSISSLYTDIICDINHDYLAMGNESYSKTLEITERLSLVEDCDKLLSSVRNSLSAIC